jgi:hypothetical protein
MMVLRETFLGIEGIKVLKMRAEDILCLVAVILLSLLCAYIF